MEFGSTAFWLALGQIIWVNILLSGDNAVVIALAARSLPPKQQKQAVIIGSAAAVVMRIALTLVAVQLMQLPWLKFIGAILLVYIGVTLLLPEPDESHGGDGAGNMFAAVRTILIADLVMSLDNVIAVAAAAKGSTLLLVLGLAISIPLVIFGSTLLLKVIDRYPMIVWLGAALLGFIAGEIMVDDKGVASYLHAFGASLGIPADKLGLAFGIAGAILVVALGKYFLVRRAGKGQGVAA